MGASISIHWPGITEEQLGNDIGFCNDDQAWARWIVELTSDPKLEALMDRLGIRALETHTTEGMKDRDVRWVSPQELSDAAWKLIRFIEANDPQIAPLLASYRKGANRVDPVENELVQDLSDVVLRAESVQKLKVKKMTFAINW